jgi:hypothetical protein
MIQDQDDIVMMMLECQMELGNFDGAFNHSDFIQGLNGEAPFMKEFKEMNVGDLWNKIKKPEMPDKC